MWVCYHFMTCLIVRRGCTEAEAPHRHSPATAVVELMMWRKALVAVSAIALLTIGLGIIVYVGVARDRLVPTPEPAPTVTVRPEPTATPVPPPAQVSVLGRVREYSPGALIIVIEPTVGQVDQIIILEDVIVVHEDDSPATTYDILPGQTLFVEGELDPLGRLIARRIMITGSVPSPTPLPLWTQTPFPSATSKATATATPSPTPMAGWDAEYFANPDIRGAPLATRLDPAIDFDWGANAPVAGLPSDQFSIRWTTRRAFEEGSYRFSARADDGVRVYVDNVLLIDGWSRQTNRLLQANVELTAGVHALRVEYREEYGEAFVQVTWEEGSAYPDWKGEYFANAYLSGTPSLVRNDPEIHFAWGTDAPFPGLPADGFSVRWTREIEVTGGPYQFIASGDDGVRVWVDGLGIIDAWMEGAGQKQVGHVWLQEGTHHVRVEYYEAYNRASVDFWWELLNTFYYWQGTYYDNPDLAGNPAFVRDDPMIDYDWQHGSPGPGLPTDGFSVHWERVLYLEKGTYRFWARADDGVRASVDGRQVVWAWHDGGTGVTEGQTTLEEGRHRLIVEYYDRTGEAFVEFGWTVAETPTPTRSPTRTSTATPTPTNAATATPTASPSPSPSKTPLPLPSPTRTATPSATSTPRPTPELTPMATRIGPLPSAYSP